VNGIGGALGFWLGISTDMRGGPGGIVWEWKEKLMDPSSLEMGRVVEGVC
jgi:hypothetical protein